MPTTREFTVQMEDRPGTIGKLCRALANRGVNILGFQASSTERRTEVRLVVDNSATAETALNAEGLAYTVAEVAQVTLPHRPGELARAASRLGDANINIHYAYFGLEPSMNAPLLFFGVTEVGRAAKVLEQAAVAASGS